MRKTVRSWQEPATGQKVQNSNSVILSKASSAKADENAVEGSLPSSIAPPVQRNFRRPFWIDPNSSRPNQDAGISTIPTTIPSPWCATFSFLHLCAQPFPPGVSAHHSPDSLICYI